MVPPVRIRVPPLKKVLQNAGFVRDEEWGRRLMAYALEHPQIEEGKKRPIVEAVDSVFSALGANYQRMRNTHRVYPESGRLLPIVPDVVGKGVEEATALLKKRGFRVVEPPEDSEGSETALAGTAPATDALAEPEAAIRLVRADGPPRIAAATSTTRTTASAPVSVRTRRFGALLAHSNTTRSNSDSSATSSRIPALGRGSGASPSPL